MIDLMISNEFGAIPEIETICLNFRRANSRDKFTAEELEERMEYLIEHELIHVVLYNLFKNKDYGNIVSWLFDYVDYSPRNIIEEHEIPKRKILLSELKGLQSKHRKMRKMFLKKYYGKMVN